MEEIAAFIALENWNRTSDDSGLTIPFLVGIEYVLKKSNKQLIYNGEIHEILKSLHLCDSSNIFVLYNCPNINEIVIGRRTLEIARYFKPIIVDGIKSKKLFTGENIEHLVGVNIESIVAYLESIYIGCISKGNFSKISENEWGPYQESEIHFIKSLQLK